MSRQSDLPIPCFTQADSHRTFTCLAVVPVASTIVRDLNHSDKPNKSASVLLVTIWEFGEAAGPFFIGPLSEIFGRYRTFNAANALFICATAMAAISQGTDLFIAARALTGLGVAANVLNPAIVGDIFVSDERGTAMSVIMLAPLIGGAIGPVMAGAIAENFGWRAVLWMSAILATACEIVFLCCFRETYKVTILRRRATSLVKATGNKNITTVFDRAEISTDGDSTKSQPRETFLSSLSKPFTILFTSPVLIAICLFGGVSYTSFYIMSTSLPDILQTTYNLQPAMTGLCFIAFSAGSTITVFVCNRTLDPIYIRLRRLNHGIGHPEFRLPLVIIGAITLPIVLSLYGWCIQLVVPLPAFLFVLGLFGASMLLCYLPLMAYVVDALGIYSASGMTAVIVTRCLMGTFLPLTTVPLVDKFEFGWGFTVLGGIAALMAPIPLTIYRFGRSWRSGSKFMEGGVDVEIESGGQDQVEVVAVDEESC